MNLSIASRRILAGVALVAIGILPAQAATYQIGLYQGGSGVGMGSFEFTNSGSSGAANASLSTNASSAIGAQTFQPGAVDVQVVAVNFTDNKTPPNTITGNFVEGITGTLRTADMAVPTAQNCTDDEACYYQISFGFTPSASNPNAAVKNYAIELRRRSNNELVATYAGTYSVANTATIPEPDALALLALALAALWTSQRRRLRRRPI